MDERDSPLIQQGWLRALIFIPAFLLGNFVFSSLGLGLAYFFFSDSTGQTGEGLSFPGNPLLLFFFQSAGLIGTLLVVIIFRTFIDRRSFSSLGFRLVGKWKDLLTGAILGFLIIAVGFFALKFTGHLTIRNVSLIPAGFVQQILLLAIVAFNEEIAFRGYLLGNLMESLNKYRALTLSALFFALMHIFNPNITFIAALNIVLAGFLLGIYYIHRKNLWFPLALHFFWNFFQGPVFGFRVSGIPFKGIVDPRIKGPEWLTGGAFGFEGSLVLSFLLGFAIITTELIYNQPGASLAEEVPYSPENH